MMGFARKVLLAAAVVGCCAVRADAQEVTLRAVSGFTEKTTYSRGFELFIERVNQAGKGVVQINYIGGPKAMPPFEIGNALKNGVVDLINATGGFYVSLMPEADAWKMVDQTQSMPVLRRNGFYDYMAKIYADKMNAILLARVVDNTPYHLYLNKPLTAANLSGFKIRIAPVYRDFFQALGASVVQIPPGEVYTALERNVVDGYGWPITGIFDLGWQEKTRFRVDPGFYSAELSILINQRTWEKLNEAQRAVISRVAQQTEAEAQANFARDIEAETARQANGGINAVRLPAAQEELFRKTAYEAGWAGIIRQSPEHGPKLKELLSTKP
jgi:TRAP-type transport system periplasmic protein